jgi:hypothetical protein
MRHTRIATLALTVAAFGLVLACRAAPAGAQPFFQPTGQSFTPQIDVVESGVKLDVQATVSADRKYVTLTMRPQQSSLVALRDFTFQNGFNPAQALGFVGFPRPAAAANEAAAGRRDARPDTRPAAAVPVRDPWQRNNPSAHGAVTGQPAAQPAQPAPSVLEREGMARVDAPAGK